MARTDVDPRWEQVLTGLPATVALWGTKVEITGYHDGMVWVVNEVDPGEPYPIRVG